MYEVLKGKKKKLKKSEVRFEEEHPDVGDARTMRHHLMLHIGNLTSPRERCILHTTNLEGQIHLSLLKLKSQTLGIELNNLLFALVGIGLALAQYFLTVLFSFLLEYRNIYYMPLNIGILPHAFRFYRGSQLRVCLKSQKTFWTLKQC